MKFALWGLFVVAFGVLVGVLLVQDAGYVLLAWRSWTLEMPLWLFFVGVALIYGLVTTAGRLFHGLAALSARIREWAGASRARSAQQKTQQGLIALAQGEWDRAEKLLAQGASAGECPAINYLSAAKAAHELGANDRGQRYLELAKKSSGAETAVSLAQAQLFYDQGQVQSALDCLLLLQKKQPKHPGVLTLLMHIYKDTQAWASLIEISPMLIKARVLNQDQAVGENENAYLNMLEHDLKIATSPAALSQAWSHIPKMYQAKPKIAAPYIEILIKQGREKEASDLIKSTLKKEWSPALVTLFGALQENPTKRLVEAENWLKTNASCRALLVSLGRLAQRAQLWGKAQRYYEAAIAEQQSAEVYGLLGELFLKLGEMDKSAQAFRHSYTCLVSQNQ